MRRHCHALNFDRNWKILFSSCSPWKSRKGDWKWATSGNNFNPKWRLKVDPWRNFWAGNSQSGRSQKQTWYLELARPRIKNIYTFVPFCKPKQLKFEKWLNILILACPILFFFTLIPSKNSDGNPCKTYKATSSAVRRTQCAVLLSEDAGGRWWWSARYKAHRFCLDTR